MALSTFDATYVSSTVFTLETDKTSIFETWRPVLAVPSSGTNVRAYVLSSTFSGTTTTVNVSGTLPALMNAVSAGDLSITDSAIPFEYLATLYAPITQSGTTGDINLSIDESYYAMTSDVITGTVSGSVDFGDTLYIQSDFTYAATDADSSSSAPAYVMALASGTGSMSLLRRGDVRLDSWSWTGGKTYLSLTTGEMTQTIPSGTADQVVICGYATASNKILFDPDLMQITVV